MVEGPKMRNLRGIPDGERSMPFGPIGMAAGGLFGALAPRTFRAAAILESAWTPHEVSEGRRAGIMYDVVRLVC